jgi:hypothetical protein
MIKNEPKRFLFRAHAVGVTAHIRAPYADHLSPEASVALGIAGGAGSKRVEKIRFRDIVSVETATVHVAGVSQGDKHSTLATAIVEGVDILGVVKADRIVARVASEHLIDGGEGEIFLAGSHFENLRIAGRLVEPILQEPLLSELSTAVSVRERGAAQKVIFSEAGGIIATSIVGAVGPIPGARVEGWRVDIREFGSIYLGEVFILPGARRLTMLRVELGCAIEGTVTIGEPDGNGHTYPP